MADYVESNDLAFMTQMDTFATNLPSYVLTFGLSPTVPTAVSLDRDWAIYTVVRAQQAAAYAEDWTKFKDLVLSGKQGAVIGPFPVPPDVTIPPAGMILPDIKKRFRALSQQLKKHGNYTKAIGENLRIEKPQTVIDPTLAKPLLKLRITGGQVEVIWVKSIYTALEILVSRNGGAWEFLTIDSVPNYIDTAPVPPAGQSQLWKYKAIYRLKDLRVGDWSDEASISVKG